MPRTLTVVLEYRKGSGICMSKTKGAKKMDEKTHAINVKLQMTKEEYLEMKADLTRRGIHMVDFVTKVVREAWEEKEKEWEKED
jgi:hypothetical protein